MYSRAFLRFWWVLALGLAAAIAVGGLVAKRHKAATYSTYSQLLVDSAQHPFLRSALGQGSSGPTTAKSAKAATDAGVGLLSPSGEGQVLVNAANFYPMLIQSDVVKAYREKTYGVIPGTVKAKAIGATQGINRYVPSIFPIIEIDATAPSADDAIRLATVSATSFGQWLRKQQDANSIPDRQRIDVLPIVMPGTATETKNTRYSLALIAGIAVFAVFLGLAVLLDRLIVPTSREVEERDRVEVKEPPRVEVGTRVTNYTA
jgi:hypothetical protein